MIRPTCSPNSVLPRESELRKANAAKDATQHRHPAIHGHQGPTGGAPHHQGQHGGGHFIGGHHGGGGGSGERGGTGFWPPGRGSNKLKSKDKKIKKGDKPPGGGSGSGGGGGGGVGSGTGFGYSSGSYGQVGMPNIMKDEPSSPGYGATSSSSFAHGPSNVFQVPNDTHDG